MPVGPVHGRWGVFSAGRADLGFRSQSCGPVGHLSAYMQPRAAHRRRFRDCFAFTEIPVLETNLNYQGRRNIFGSFKLARLGPNCAIIPFYIF
jgi:hypothetical protein